MNNIKCLMGNYACSTCNRTHSFSEKTFSCAVRRLQCNHFNLILIRINDNNNFKLKITLVCKICNHVHRTESKIGKYNQNNKFITDDFYSQNCCGNNMEVTVFLSEEFIDQNEPINNNAINMDIRNYDLLLNDDSNFNNNNINNNNINNNIIIDDNIINDNIININNINNNNNNVKNAEINDNKIELKKFDDMNIIEFDKKNKLVNFLDDQTKKKYKIYTKKEIKLKYVLEDLSNQFPEINYKNKKLLVNGNEMNPEFTIAICNLNNNNEIIIK